MAEFVPPDFEVPPGIETSEFVLEPLGPEHNDEMAPEENRADLERHAEDFRNRRGFTYTVLDPASRDVIGCVHIYPVRDTDCDACALSWVRESHARLDTPLWRAVSEWLASDWPFANVQYAPRP